MSKFCILCLLLPLAAPAADEAKPASHFGAEFAKHWLVAKDLAIAVAQAMPADSYGFKPVPEEMSFGEQIVHIAQANYSYCAAAAKGKSPFAKPEKIDKDAAVKVLGESFDYCGGIASTLTDDQLNESRARGKTSVTVRELLLGVQTHMAHHRGQAEVYLRVKGIKPPDYNF
jgi:uncharacterized damage-inducible protein DinB